MTAPRGRYDRPVAPVECERGDCRHLMQRYCSECGREQYAMAVWAISHGSAGCAWCGQNNPVMIRRSG